MSYLQIAADVRQEAHRYRNQYFRHVSKDESTWAYDHDITVSIQLFSLDDLTLGKVISTATARNLKNLGYTGARSNSGISLCPLMTALLNRVVDKFGRDAIWNQASEEAEALMFRGVKHDPQVLVFWVNELNALIVKLLNLHATQFGDQTN